MGSTSEPEYDRTRAYAETPGAMANTDIYATIVADLSVQMELF